jgi:hypothetical protein
MEEEAKAMELAEKIMAEVSQYSLEKQNELLETVVRKLSTGRDREALELEHKAMLIRNASHDLKNRLSILNHNK